MTWAISLGSNGILSISPLIMTNQEQTIKQYCRGLGFDLVGITTADAFGRDEQAAIDRIRHGMMDGLAWYTEERVRQANKPQSLLPGAKSVVSLATSYLNEGTAEPREGPTGKIARYAWGDDYHDLLKSRLRRLADHLPQLAGRPVSTRIFVDDGPMNDRAAAERAGVGWFGKNTNILTSSHGSWVLLGQIVTDLELEPDRPLAKNCGECVRCIDDCPTGAIVAPYVIDNTRCISFLTIENRGPIPREFRPLIGNWVFGCDICQEVCPVNEKARSGREPAFQQRHDFDGPALIPLLGLDDEGFRERFRNSALKRAKRVCLQRNVCVALGNLGDPVALPALAKALESADALVRSHAAWALGRIGGNAAIDALRSSATGEPDTEAAQEIDLALAEAGAPVRRD
jgi:epoxyqueuosine reductase